MQQLFERILMLKSGQVFTHVTTDELRVVAGELIEENYLAGDRVFDINERGDHMYIIESGKIGISLSPDPTKQEFISTLSSGDCFGEMGMLDELPRSATAHVLEDSTLLVLEKACLTGLIHRYPDLALGMLRSLSMRLRETNAQLENRKPKD